MKVEILDKKDLYIKIKINNVTPQFVNLIRRVLISQTPSVAIDDVIIMENSSIMYDEMLAHRIGLIPLKTDIFSLKEEDTFHFKLEVEAKSQDLVVFSKDLIPSEPNISPAYDSIPICKLAKGQKILLEAIARVKTGNVHAKFQPVAACAYKQINKDTFIFHFESTGIDNPEKIFLKSIEIIIKKFDELLKIFKEIKK